MASRPAFAFLASWLAFAFLASRLAFAFLASRLAFAFLASRLASLEVERDPDDCEPARKDYVHTSMSTSRN